MGLFIHTLIPTDDPLAAELDAAIMKHVQKIIVPGTAPKDYRMCFEEPGNNASLNSI